MKNKESLHKKTLLELTRQGCVIKNQKSVYVIESSFVQKIPSWLSYVGEEDRPQWFPVLRGLVQHKGFQLAFVPVHHGFPELLIFFLVLSDLFLTLFFGWIANIIYVGQPAIAIVGFDIPHRIIHG